MSRARRVRLRQARHDARQAARNARDAHVLLHKWEQGWLSDAQKKELNVLRQTVYNRVYQQRREELKHAQRVTRLSRVALEAREGTSEA